MAAQPGYIPLRPDLEQNLSLRPVAPPACCPKRHTDPTSHPLEVAPASPNDMERHRQRGAARHKSRRESADAPEGRPMTPLRERPGPDSGIGVPHRPEWPASDGDADPCPANAPHSGRRWHDYISRAFAVPLGTCIGRTDFSRSVSSRNCGSSVGGSESTSTFIFLAGEMMIRRLYPIGYPC